MLYFFRAGFSALWVTVVLSLSSSAAGANLGTRAGALLVLYPLSDVVATVFDLSAPRSVRSRLPQLVNLVAGIAATIAIFCAVFSGLAATITVFGVWAVVSGGVQLIVGARRRRALGGQWLMIISGAGSVFAGTSFVGWAGSSTAGLTALGQYSAGGAVWYLLTAVWLSRSERSTLPVPRTHDSRIPVFEGPPPG
jgi:uncharacterized membrane protein HdeD (DUF308 family)